MSIVRVLINEATTPTEAEIKKFRETALKELATLNDSHEKIFCDEDCPELTDEQLARLMPVHTREKNFWRNYG